MFNIPIEIQIRTEEMEAIGEYGVAAHVGYTENKGSTLMTQNQIDWIKRLQDIVKAYKSVDDKEGFKNELDIEVLEKNIFCYTPKGDIIELPKGSTLLDFAFRIHSDVGLKFKNGIVNGLIKPLGYSLQTGDIIDIETYKNKYTASRHRLEYLHTPTAKTKLNKFINQHEIAESLKKAVDLFNRKLTEHKLPKLYSNGDLISSTHNKEKLNALLIKMLEKHHMVEPFLKKIYKDHESFMTPKTTTAKKSGSTTSSNIIIDQNQQFTYQLCPECLPNPLDRIIAKSSKTGIKIHTLTCKALKTIMFDKLYEAHRAGEESTRYKFTLHLEIATHLTNLVNIMKLFDELKIKVVSMNIETTENDSTLLAIQSEFQNPNKIHFLLKELRKNEPSLLIVKKELA